jgi:hypothetical protein
MLVMSVGDAGAVARVSEPLAGRLAAAWLALAELGDDPTEAVIDAAEQGLGAHAAWCLPPCAKHGGLLVLHHPDWDREATAGRAWERRLAAARRRAQRRAESRSA